MEALILSLLQLGLLGFPLCRVQAHHEDQTRTYRFDLFFIKMAHNLIHNSPQVY